MISRSYYRYNMDLNANTISWGITGLFNCRGMRHSLGNNRLSRDWLSVKISYHIIFKKF